MIHYVTGNLLESKAQALVNTVNCEGYMGKGIAYQFKQAYPETNKSYMVACDNGNLKIGTIHYYVEKEKIIINLPTKDKWRAKSKMEYVETGLNQLLDLIKVLHISSVAIPPLGSGNGGLVWSDVKEVVEKKLHDVSNDVTIYVYEPSNNYVIQHTPEPQLPFSALILMQIKLNLTTFNSTRLQHTSYILDVLSEQKNFNFTKHKDSIHDSSIDVIAKKIKEFQKYHNTERTEDAYNIAFNKLISDTVERRMSALMPLLKKASSYVNAIGSDKELKCITIILYILQRKANIDETQLIKEMSTWMDASDDEIKHNIEYLYRMKMIEKTLMGYTIAL